MDPFFQGTYVGHSQGMAAEPNLASAFTTSVRNAIGSTANTSGTTNTLAHSLASLTLDGVNTNAMGVLGAADVGLYPKSVPYGQIGGDVSPLLNGSPSMSRNTTPVPPLTYQPHVWLEQENVGGTTYYYPEEAQQPDIIQDDLSSPHLFPNFSMYCIPPPHLKEYSTKCGSVAPANPVVHPNSHRLSAYFIPQEMRQEIIQKNSTNLSQPNRHLYPDLPLQVENFFELCPLELPTHKSATFGYPTSVYRAINGKTGFPYCLRRIQGYRFPNGKCQALIDAWKQITHTNIVCLRDVITTKAFGDSSLIFVYDYFSTAESLMSRHFGRNSQANGYVDPFNTGDPSVPRPYSHQKNALLRHHQNMLPENLLWAYIIQLSSAIRTIHTAGLAVRSLDPTKVLVISKTRPAIRLNCCGVYDIVAYEPSNNLVTMNQFYQLDDLLALGKLILALACNSILAIQHENLNTSLELITRNYSSDLRNLIVYLMNPRASGNRTINDIMPMIGARFYNQLDSANARADHLEDALAKEVENGRLFRLLVKLNTVVERHDLNMDTSWAETGDRYLLKLFRDYVFHSVGPDGRPWVDMAHVVYCLNRLDAGIGEKVCLMSRDEQSILITTFGELKVFLEQSFEEIINGSNSMVKVSPQHQHHTAMLSTSH